MHLLSCILTKGDAFMTPKHAFRNISRAVLLLEAIFLVFILSFASYTEIDWRTYMEQVIAFVKGSHPFQYDSLKGSTGPAVYPAGHIYIFTAMYYITNEGRNIRCAQTIFAVLYWITCRIVLALYAELFSTRGYLYATGLLQHRNSIKRKANYLSVILPFTVILLSCSRRLHSIYLLRMFNDPFSVIFIYIAILLWTKRQWVLGSLFYSLALSIKMSALLYAPAVLLTLLSNQHFYGVTLNLFLMGIVQLLLAAPFLLTSPRIYFIQAFDFSRTFQQKWSINGQFWSESLFYSQRKDFFLIICTLVAWAGLTYRWSRILRRKSKQTKVVRAKSELIRMFFEFHLVGVIFARSLHYQFYSWFFHQLLYLSLHSPPKMIILSLSSVVLIEASLNVYPSTCQTSLQLLISLVIIFLGSLCSPILPFVRDNSRE